MIFPVWPGRGVGTPAPAVLFLSGDIFTVSSECSPGASFLPCRRSFRTLFLLWVLLVLVSGSSGYRMSIWCPFWGSSVVKRGL